MNHNFDLTNVWVPSTIHLEEPASLLFAELVSQEHEITPASLNSGVRTTPAAAVSTREAARKLSRILHAHFGYVPNTFEDLLAGGVTYNNGIKVVSTAAQQFKNDVVPDLVSQAMTDKYGPSSFFRAFGKGKVSTVDCQTLNATAAERATTTGHQHTKLGRRVMLYARLEARPPQSEVNINTITTIAQANAALKTPLWDLPQIDRADLWIGMLTPDVYASFFETSTEIVDLRRMWRVPDANVEGDVNVHRDRWLKMWGVMISAVYEKIRNTYRDTGDTEVHGQWTNVPVLRAENQGRKRKAGNSGACLERPARRANASRMLPG
ncbi:hypothetical protein FB567DRAFT_548296 [Paraphoma chrysanthemicola]|uniref:Uncharacterized protein n=1 Tax=Paraphoma chrysanthemicola TaxID=798071 RepID=A0A8K0R9W5_9PLEO|nr:hypothetical protein FB567DRAFT_548296 [Paraphoma chrysanthemicola]